MLKDLLYVNEHVSCGHYVSDHRCCFHYYEDEPGDRIEQTISDFNLLVFILEGEVRGDFNEYSDRHFKAGEICYLPKTSKIAFTVLKSTRVLTCMFEVPHNVCDKMNFHSCAPLCEQITYDFDAGTIRPQMQQFVDSLVYYLRNGINCEHFHELKQNEMFLIFRWFYPKEELATLFYPMIGKSLDFRAVILGNYANVKSVNDLANIVHMGRSTFDTTFKEEFGMPPHQWLLKQKANHIRHYLNDPEVTISDVIRKYEFNSHTHFTRFCKQQFGCTPTQLIASIRRPG